MYTAVHHDTIQQANQYNAVHHPGGYVGESNYITPIYSPTKVASPPNKSNLQTLRKFSNLQSLQNLTNMTNDSPRASYSSTSSSTTSSSSSNLIIPEIFKQDQAAPPSQSSYPPPPPQHLPPKPRNTQSPPQLNHTQLPNSNYLHHPQPLPPQTAQPPIPKYSQSYYTNGITSQKIDLGPLQRPQTNDPIKTQSSVSGSINNAPCSSSFQKYPSTYGFVSPTSNVAQMPFAQQQQHLQNSSGCFTSYPNSSSFTSYTSSTSHFTNSANPQAYIPPAHLIMAPANGVPPRSPPHTTLNGVFQNFPGGGTQPNLMPDARRLSDSNTRRGGTDVLQNQMINNEYLPHKLPNTCTPERPGEHRINNDSLAMSKQHDKLHDNDNKSTESQQKQQLQTQLIQEHQNDSNIHHSSNLNCGGNVPSKACNNSPAKTNNAQQSPPKIISSQSPVKNIPVNNICSNTNSNNKNNPLNVSSSREHNSTSQQQKEQKLPQQQLPKQQHKQLVQQHKSAKLDEQSDNKTNNIKSQISSEPSQIRNHSRESRGISRERPSHGYVRHEYFPHSSQEYPNKSLEYLNKPQEYSSADTPEYLIKKPDYPNKPHDYQSKSQEYLNKSNPQDYPTSKSQEYHGKVIPEYPIKPQPYKSRTGDVIGSSRQQSPPTMSGTPASGGGSTSNGLRERVVSPHRVTSPPTKLSDSSRLQTPPVKMIDTRTDYSSKLENLNNSAKCVKLDGGMPSLILSPKNPSAHFLQQYPEKDNSKSQAPVWEAGYLLEKYTGGPYSPLPPVHPAARSEKAIDDQSYPSCDPRSPTTSGGINCSTKDSDLKYQAEREDAEVSALHSDLQKISATKVSAKLLPLNGLPDQLEVYSQSNTQHAHLSPAQCQGHLSSMSPETTDCGSLSKSSSDGDHSFMNRKRPPTKLKSKRRNILSFPHHLSVDELRLIQRREDSYGGGGGSSSDDNRSSGHASMSDGHTSSSPPVDTLPRHHDHHMRSPLKAVPEDERLSAGVTAGGTSVGRGPIGGGRRAHQPQKGGRYRPGIGPVPAHKGELSLECANGLEDIKLAIEQLTMRSQGSRTSYSTSTYSSMSGSEGEPNRRLVRHSSLETVNTNVTAADEFVWVDSHDRLVELQQLPWSNHDVLRVIQQGRVREQLDRVSIEAVPRLSYLLQRALVRVAREAQRLTRPLAMCSKQEISSAFKIVLSPALADSCIKSCLRAAAMYTVSGDHLRQAKAARAGLNLSVGRFVRWMCDVRVGKFIHEYAAVYLTAGLENLLEEMVLQCLPAEEEQMLTAALLEHAIANNADLWGLLQPYAHLNAGRTATGALCLPRWASTGSMERSSSTSSTPASESSPDSANTSVNTSSDTADTSSTGGSVAGALGSGSGCASNGNHASRCSSSMTLTPDEHSRGSKTLEQSLLTTCVGSLAELSDLLCRVASHHQTSRGGSGSTSSGSTSATGPTNSGNSNSRLLTTPTGSGQHSVPGSSSTVSPMPSRPGSSIGGVNKALVTWGPSALHALFYFMRCSQLEHAEHASRAPIQELVYERPYIVLPPLVEWVRVATAHTDHRHSTVVDKDDVMQAARLLLPGVDCPVRTIGYEELMCPRRQLDELECAQKFKVDLAFKMLSCGRTELVPHALQLLPDTKVNTVNEYGLTPLMLACIRGDEALVTLLLNASADVDAETPPTGPAYLMANPETQHWTALTYATIHGHYSLAQTLLARGANVEGGATLADEKCTETPLQVGVAAGHTELVGLLLSCGANPYLSTLMKDSLCYSGAAQRGCYAAIAVAAAHGQRNILHKLLAHPTQQNASAREVLSLEEILAEGASSHTNDREKRGRNINVTGTCAILPGANSNNSSHSSSSSSSSSGVGSASSSNFSVGSGGSTAGSANSSLTEDQRLNGKGSITSSSSDVSLGLKLTKQQVKTLQEAMYHSAESGHLEMTLDLRNLGVPWTLHCWMHTLATAHEHRLETIIDQLLQDFLQVWPDDYSAQFVEECLPLLFTIFRYSKNEGTSLLLADIFSSCYGKEAVKEVLDTSVSGGARIDIGFVNNPELSDVQFRVEGRVFYAHKIILVNASSRFKQMLSSKFCEGNPPIVQIHDIRYGIFELVMQSLYKGGCRSLVVEAGDVLELMAAANFFQLDSLLRYCEARCSTLVHLHNVVSMYIHAKVYGALQLLEYCQGFLLQNMVALLTHDDSVRRLIFGKKLHNHDVLAGLLTTLQSRIKSRASPRAGKN